MTFLLTAPAQPLLLPAPTALLLPAPKTTIVSVSGGLGSFGALKLALQREPKVAAVFADVKGTGYSHFWSDLPEVDYLLHERFGGESRETYRFLWQMAHALNCPIERLTDGRSIWAVAAKERAFRIYAGGRHLCKSSELLKREQIARWIESHYQPGTYRIALGMGVLEPHRIKGAQAWWRERLGWDVEVYSPLIQEHEGYGLTVDNCLLAAWALELGLEIPPAYSDGLPHNNCNMFCFLAGQSQYEIAYRVNRLAFYYVMWQEKRVQKHIGTTATILKTTKGGKDGKNRSLSMEEFEQWILASEVDSKDIGHGCSCQVFLPKAQMQTAMVEV